MGNAIGFEMSGADSVRAHGSRFRLARATAWSGRVWLALLMAWLACGTCVAASTPDMMLATPMPVRIDVSRYWVSEKLDGVRARWDGGTLTTRGGARVAAPGWFTHGWPGVALDGELWLGRGRFEAASALVRAQAPEDPRWREMKFMVFDLPGDAGPFDARLVRLRARVEAAQVPWLQAVPQFRVAHTAQLQTQLRAVVSAGGEGLMLHHSQARYVAGRSALLHKLKPFDDAEAVVIGHLPGKGKYVGKMGALWLQRPDGRRFRLGTGFTDAQRARPPPLGVRITYRYSGLTNQGLPRFARFLRIREDEPSPR